MKTETKHPLETADWGLMQIVNYKGKLVSKFIGGYSIFGIKCKTPEEVDKVIENAENGLEASIIAEK